MSTTLITGATGGLGSAVAKFLSKKKDISTISVLVRDPNADKAKALTEKGFGLKIADYDNKEALINAFEGIDELYFVSGSDLSVRTQQHKNVVEAATETKVKHIFYTSVSSKNLSESAPLYEGMKSHFETEKWIKESGMKYTILRHNLYSEVIAMFLGEKEQLLQSKTVFLPTGTGKTAFVPRIEFAEAGANLLAHPSEHANKIYELNGSDTVSFEEIASYISEATGETIGYVSPSVEEFESTLTSYGLPKEIIGMTIAFSLAIAEGVFDAEQTDLEMILGRKTQPVKEFIKTVYGS